MPGLEWRHLEILRYNISKVNAKRGVFAHVCTSLQLARAARTGEETGRETVVNSHDKFKRLRRDVHIATALRLRDLNLLQFHSSVAMTIRSSTCRAERLLVARLGLLHHKQI